MGMSSHLIQKNPIDLALIAMFGSSEGLSSYPRTQLFDIIPPTVDRLLWLPVCSFFYINIQTGSAKKII